MKALIATALAAIFAMPAWAQANCAERAQVLDILRGKYQEETIARGIDARGRMVEWWGNSETGSWTAVLTKGGQSCIVGQGWDFFMTEPAVNGEAL
ncbi:hypothetical protein N6L27_03385 [Leisingera sp. SS27]|uniref:hypothetical protein n=1 Tax=Leisingera sp. SS27 TaxID=2979462 RepID=UPI00232DB58D|nr:hypothetical protein [Leisingera sp. SS27]MDC0657033.1 hypothetical protein [Leisingera sp. SS27]